MVFRRLLQKRSHRMELGTTRRRLEIPARTALRDRLQTRRRRPCRIRRGSTCHLDGNLRESRTRSRHPRRHGKQAGQFLDDGRNGPADPAASSTSTSPPTAEAKASSSTPTPIFASRSGTSSSSSSTRTPQRKFHPPLRSARRYRHGLRASRRRHANDQRLQRFLKTRIQLRYRRLFPHLFQTRRALRKNLRLHPTRRWQTGQRARGNRHCFPRHRGSPASPLLLHCGRYSARQQRPQLRLASNLAAGHTLRARPLAFPTPSFTDSHPP